MQAALKRLADEHPAAFMELIGKVLTEIQTCLRR
jgi:hypothetical protein